MQSDAKSLENVEYVDVAVGNTEGYVRFRDKNTVQEIMQSKPWENMSILEGKEEEHGNLIDYLVSTFVQLTFVAALTLALRERSS